MLWLNAGGCPAARDIAARSGVVSISDDSILAAPCSATDLQLLLAMVNLIRVIFDVNDPKQPALDVQLVQCVTFIACYQFSMSFHMLLRLSCSFSPYLHQLIDNH